MNFLDAWTTLDPLSLARWLAPAACVAPSVVLPGRGVARLAALGVALALPFVPAGAPALVTAAWCALWLAVAWLGGRPGAGERSPRPGRALLGGLESSAAGIAVGLALLGLLVAALARADLGPDADRRAALALLMLGLGLMHLMLRRRVRRAALSFAALGYGVQVLEYAAGTAQGGVGWSVGPLAATVLAVALAGRLAAAREHAVGSDRIALSHDLHD